MTHSHGKAARFFESMEQLSFCLLYHVIETHDHTTILLVPPKSRRSALQLGGCTLVHRI